MKMTKKTRLYAIKSGNLTVRYNPVTVRFWTFYRNSRVKLTLREGKHITFGFSAPHDEGYSFEGYRYFIEDNLVVQEWTSGGRDCDGSMHDKGTLFCPLNDLAKIEPYIPNDETQPKRNLFNGKLIHHPDWKFEHELCDT